MLLANRDASSYRLFFLYILIVLLSPVALAQTVSVQMMTDALMPADFGSSYPLGQLSNSSYSYGSGFIIKVSYADASGHSLSLALSGSQPNYELAWRVADTSDNHSFSSNLGASVTGLSGSAADLYYRHDGTLQTLSSEATRYQMGAKATPYATVDLDLQVSLTATLY